MAPNTAQSLRARKRNKLRDFVDVAGALQVSFFLIVSATDKNSYLRLVRSPRGPTLTFKVNAFSLSSDVAKTLRKPYSPSHSIWESPPMLVLSNFDKSVQHEALSATMLQNLFPTLNVAKARLATFRRVVLVHQLPEAEGGGAELRHYVIRAAPTGVTKGIKKLVRANKLPSLGRYSDMADFLERQASGGGLSGSESGAETDEEDQTELPQDYVGRLARKSQRVSIKLTEIGPRLSLKLLKVEEGLCDGATLYHSLVSKSEEEAAETAARVQARQQLKAERKAAQAENVARKQQAAQEKAERRKRRRGLGGGSDAGSSAAGSDAGSELGAEDGDDAYEYGADDGADEDAEVDDAEWFRREVGEEPAAELGLHARPNQHGSKRAAAADGPTADRGPPSGAKAAAAAKRTAKSGGGGPKKKPRR